LTDVVIWIAATDIAALARYDFVGHDVRWEAISVLSLFLAGGQLVLGAVPLMSRRRYVIGSFDELRIVGVTATAVSAIAFTIVAAIHPGGVPRSVPFVAWPLALVGMAGIRLVKRLIGQARISHDAAAERVVIVGAGWIGSTLTLRMRQDARSPFVPVAFLDDDPAKRNLVIQGVRVRGTVDGLAEIAAQTEETRVVVAVNNADSAFLRKISDLADSAGIGMLVLPPLSEQLLRSQLQVSALRDVDVEDLVGRRPVDTDITSIAEYVTGKRVLVTGAGGSIGSELCRQLHKFGPAELVMLDRDESGLHAVQLSIEGHGLLQSPAIALCDIRDSEALREVFLQHRPDVVFHAAALKHLPLLERYPHEAYKTNVIGSLNVLRAAADVEVTHFVNVSTDKAADATSVLGYSKRLAERLTSWYSAHSPDSFRYLSVRFGNVLGSRGSVLHSFAAQIERGGPVTVTDPEVTRYFMTIPEACQLVIQAGAIGRPGEALVLDMGEPVKILDVAQRMISMSSKATEIVFTGLRPGEKLREDLIAESELGDRPIHPLISHVDVPNLDPMEIEDVPWIRELDKHRRFTSGSRVRTAAVGQ
jgi:FlaA1/EpsC-like NDP-sugar epimerase